MTDTTITPEVEAVARALRDAGVFYSYSAARAAIVALDAARAEAGLVIVPREPTPAMKRAFGDLGDGYGLTNDQVGFLWPGMIAAAEAEREGGKQ